MKKNKAEKNYLDWWFRHVVINEVGLTVAIVVGELCLKTIVFWWTGLFK